MTEPALRAAVVLATTEDSCRVRAGDTEAAVAYAPQFPAPRAERVSPGHVVAIALGPTGPERVVWRWYDAVVLGAAAAGGVRLWEPAHGVVVADARDPGVEPEPGTRAYLSAGLPGADWWVAGPVVGPGGPITVELDAVRRLYSEHGLWAATFPTDFAPAD